MKETIKERLKKAMAAPVPGDYGYIQSRKKRQLIKVVIWAVIIAAVVAGGWIATGTRMNTATVAGVILVLPAARSLLSFVVVARYHTGSREEYNKIRALVKENALVVSDLVLTRYEGSMAITMAVIHGGNIAAYVPKQRTAPDKIREYLNQCKKSVSADGSVSVYTDFEKFYAFIKKMSAAKSAPGEKEERLMQDLLSRSV